MNSTGSASVTRGVRAARGAAGAAIATLLAAASHSLAGGVSSWFAVAATAMLALPLCTLLAGRIGSLWRLGLAVVVAQFPFHWAFSSLGAASSVSGSGPAVSPHAAHLESLQAFVPSASAASLDLGMWLGHLIAAIATIALLHAGERAFLGFARLVRRALAIELPALPTPRPYRRARAAAPVRAALRIVQVLGTATITHRGPPASWA